ncbi:MAG: MerR family transcriptional regulator [Candidatus Dormibacteraeota bacterium]|nr:MerR family transcriptional regulator [Candidatus Dormibacteraeota bacterium]
MSSSDRFTIGEVAAMVGVSTHTVRAWERRHHLLAPDRSGGGQRRYTTEDLEVLLRVRRAVAGRGLSLKLAVKEAQGELSLPAPASPARAQSGDGHAPGRRGEAESVWHTVADRMSQAILVFDGDERVAGVNAAASEALGVPPEALIGAHLSELALDLLEWAPRTLLEQHVRERAAFRATISVRGAERWDLMCRPFVHRGAEHVALFATREGGTPSSQPPG